MAILETFAPAYGSGIVVSPGAASASSTIGRGSKSLTLTNLGTEVCYVRVGAGTVTASTADYPMPIGAQVSISKNQDHDTVAYISANGTSLHIIPGEGF